MKDQTIQTEWLAIPSNVVDPVPAEVTKYIRHMNNNKEPGSDYLNIEIIKATDEDSKMMAQLTNLCKSLLKESGKRDLEDPSMCLSTRKGTTLTARTI